MIVEILSFLVCSVALFRSRGAFPKIECETFHFFLVSSSFVSSSYTLSSSIPQTVLMTSWIIGSITLLVVKNDEKNGEYRENLKLLEEYSAMNAFDKPLKKRLKTQLKLDFNNREVSDENVLQNFPRSLRRKVIRKLYFPILQVS